MIEKAEPEARSLDRPGHFGMSRAESGRLGAERRWGPPRRVNIGDLPPDQRRVVLAHVEALRLATTIAARVTSINEKAPPVSETSGEAQEARRAVDELPPAA